MWLFGAHDFFFIEVPSPVERPRGENSGCLGWIALFLTFLEVSSFVSFPADGNLDKLSLPQENIEFGESAFILAASGRAVGISMLWTCQWGWSVENEGSGLDWRRGQQFVGVVGGLQVNPFVSGGVVDAGDASVHRGAFGKLTSVVPPPTEGARHGGMHLCGEIQKLKNSNFKLDGCNARIFNLSLILRFIPCYWHMKITVEWSSRFMSEWKNLLVQNFSFLTKTESQREFSNGEERCPIESKNIENCTEACNNMDMQSIKHFFVNCYFRILVQILGPMSLDTNSAENTKKRSHAKRKCHKQKFCS